MQDKTKIQLSQTEKEVMYDRDFFLTKHRVIEKVFKLFAILAEKMKMAVADHNNLPQEWIKSTPRIFKGENYLQLPYVMLDYPAIYRKENILAIRTMFWWGNFISVSLHISGAYKELLNSSGDQLLQLIQEQKLFVCINKNQWQHHFEEDNYLPADKLTSEKWNEILSGDFIKLSQKIPLTLWDNADELPVTYFTGMLRILLLVS
ncbi:hypothetical protein BH09BAC2_BH09BAC2_19940 [soil metagenome]